VRLRGPESTLAHGKRGATYIRADIELPEKYRSEKLLDLWNPDGTYPVEVVVNHNRKTLAPFLASGDLEWDGWRYCCVCRGLGPRVKAHWQHEGREYCDQHKPAPTPQPVQPRAA
jgi:hypothetical protein